MNSPQSPRNSGTFRTMVEKSTDSTWKRWALIAGAIASFGGAVKVVAPVAAPLFGFAMQSDLKWRTDKLLAMEQAAANKEMRIAILEAETIHLKEQIQDLKISLRAIER